MRVINRSRNCEVASQVEFAEHFFQRLKGLLGRSKMRDEQGLWIPHCQGVHTVGMRIWIDAVYLSAEGRVIHLESFLRPNRLGTVCWSAQAVLELAAGKISRADLRMGDLLELTGG